MGLIYLYRYLYPILLLINPSLLTDPCLVNRSMLADLVANRGIQFITSVLFNKHHMETFLLGKLKSLVRLSDIV